jgi:hypothetical protein
MSILTVGSIPDRGMRFNLPISIVPLRCTDNAYEIFQPPVAYLGDEQIISVAHPRPGSFGPHGHRKIQNNWIQLLTGKCKNSFIQQLVNQQKDPIPTRYEHQKSTLHNLGSIDLWGSLIAGSPWWTGVMTH